MKIARRVITAAALTLVLSPCLSDSQARQKSRAKRAAPAKGAKAKAKTADEPVSELARLRAQLVESTREYKVSLAQLLDLYEKEVKRADERVNKTTELFRAGLISRRDLERDEEEAVKARAKVASVEGQLKSADVQIAETLVEAEAEEAAAKALAKAKTAPRAAGGLLTTTAYIRYGGTRAWTLSEAGSVGQFFARSFGRQLPVSSFGQSPVHDRWGYAHHNAMDVGVNPDTVEGRALMDYLRGAGIPFTAFRYAIPGTATGPHIHVGRPSHKITPR
jgi:Outer membrane efflux protein